MSLNGLDDVKVKEAHDAANAEPAGWFLLKYASRDEIDILDTGNGGISDIRSAIAKYEEPSPLYGFLRYRRRSVIIKYIPEDCSRLVQARAAVHFTAICDQFVHNATFEISDAKELKDSKLSAACSLHTASGSSSSSTSSLRRRRLNEIAEEEEEEERERKRKSAVKEEERQTSSVYSDHSALPPSPEPPVVLDRQQMTEPLDTAFAASTRNVPDFTGAHAPSSPTISDFDRRLSSQSARHEVYSSTSYTQGRKVKLGPRPSVDAHKRPSTAENIRPIAALPAGFKFFKGSKKSKSQEQGQSEQVDHVSPATPTAPRPPSPSVDDQFPQRPVTSSGASIKSTTTSMAPARDGKITPEKARLMKAMKLREKRLQDAKLEHASPTKENFSAGGAGLTTSDASGAIGPPVSPTTRSDTQSRDVALDSHPSSPGAASSTGIGDSTKASSLSDLTDETIQASKDPAEGVDEGVKEDTNIMKGSSSQRNTPLQNNTATTDTSQPGTIVNNVSGEKFTRDAEEFAQIPRRNPDVSQPTEPMTREPDSLHESNSLDKAMIQETSTTPTTPSLKSKFSRQDIDVPTDSSLPALAKTAPTPSSADSHYTKPRPEILLASPPKPSRHRVAVEPILTDLPAKSAIQVEPSDPLDDDALMDELQTATVQEAKPMLVSKSPITPVFPNSGSPPRKDARLPRAASNPMRSSLLMPVDMSQATTPRSVSSGGAATSNSLTRNPSNASVQSKKSNVGSSISQRIKALEALSGHTTEDRPRSTAPSSTFFTVRKQSTREPSKPHSVVDRAGSLTRQPPTPEDSQEPMPEASSSNRERSSSVASRLSMFEGQNTSRGRPESIQVTARIIRGATSPVKHVTNMSRKPGDGATTEFRQSTLLVDIHRAQSMTSKAPTERPPVADRPKTSVSEIQEQESTAATVNKQAKRRSSMSLMKNFIKEHTPLSNKSTENVAATSPGMAPLKSPSRPPSVHQTSTSFVRRLSTSSRRSSFNNEGDNASTPGATRSSSRISDSGSVEDDKSLSDKKSKNRTSRFMRRLSNSFTGARKAGSASISPTVAEEEADQLEKTAPLAKQPVSSPTIVAFMGDVNVQFPDNLLWKRRSMCLDAQGFLFLSTVQGSAKKVKDNASTKRFHLGDFRKPYIPDVEIQELPNSVVLDFVEGSSLQVACGDRTEQQNILQILQEAHQRHAN
ncbi:hypothetical protein FHL15_007977 [Xylaria flabelliformis]|uniref:Uncharacterized protein n=1 Tax=Xylaria flabelliformis TaxID=2512241 RepID=A0A553HTA7_9PEZI|nr:hypothetical protein FHL15_007977 [Xylaria flabelliformis]